LDFAKWTGSQHDHMPDRRTRHAAIRDRKSRKRTFRALWNQRINAAVRPLGMTCGRFIDGLARSGMIVERRSDGSTDAMNARRCRCHLP